MTARAPLAAVLRERGALVDGEDLYLSSPEVLALDPKAQLDALRVNRRVGLWVTAFAGGVRLVLLALGALVMPLAALDGQLPIAWWSIGVWVALVVVVVWLAPRFVGRVRSLGRQLPEWSEIEAEVRARS